MGQSGVSGPLKPCGVGPLTSSLSTVWCPFNFTEITAFDAFFPLAGQTPSAINSEIARHSRPRQMRVVATLRSEPDRDAAAEDRELRGVRGHRRHGPVRSRSLR